MLLKAAVAGGITYAAWKTVTPITKVVLTTALVAMLWDSVVLPDSEFGWTDLAFSAALATGILAVVSNAD